MNPKARAHTTRPRVVMVSTRELDVARMDGRLRVAHAIRTSLAEGTDLSVIRLRSALTDVSVRRVWECSMAWLGSLLRGAPLPLQCALFAAASDIRSVVDQIPDDCVSVYTDGVRTYSLVAYLRRKRPDVRIVVDLDDLMSRRMSLLLQASQPLSPGYLMRLLPKPLRVLAMSSVIGQLIVRYERMTLRNIEGKLAPLVDALVLLSSEDAKVLIEQSGEHVRSSVEVIPPPTTLVSKPVRPSKPIRFVFIGSDTQTQNRLTIDYLVDLWRRRNLTAPLVFYGLWMRDIPLPPHVVSAGYAEELVQVYDGSSVLLSPSLIAGGVKTKVLEAFAHGVAVIGSSITFESMNTGDYPLRVDDEDELVKLLTAPDEQAERFEAAAQAGADYIKRLHSPEVFGERWRAIMTPRA